jgi:hypothetical protein
MELTWNIWGKSKSLSRNDQSRSEIEQLIDKLDIWVRVKTHGDIYGQIKNSR